MKVLHTIAEFRAWRRALPPGAFTPFVPTMGALHDGHASLVRRARAVAGAAGHIITSIFVNPTQFGPAEDFARYPRTLDADSMLLHAAGCDAVFVPTGADMYPGLGAASTDALQRMTSIDAGALANTLEGALRPGHFRGVCTVVAKLLNIVEPTHLLLGQKDFQQQAVLRAMCSDLNMPVEVITCPTLRESDGLAMSSRNRYLSTDDRPRAAALYEALTWARDTFATGERDRATLEAGMHQRLLAHALVPQYSVIVDAHTMAAFPSAINAPAVALIAAKLGKTRLIDNMLL